MKKVVIVGAGASGLVAAISAAKSGASVTVIEKNNKAGKKLLATGNGRCNMTNLSIDVSKYRSSDMNLLKAVLKKYPPEKIVDFFDDIALKVRNIDGYVYPYSMQASTVVDKLVNSCISLGVKLKYDSVCQDITKLQDGSFDVILSDNYKINCDKVIIASGLVAGVNIKGENISENEIFATKLAKKTGHNVFDVVPGLTGLKCKNTHQSKVSGVRWECAVSTYIDNEKIYEDRGELQFADYGISGIVVFQNARFASYGLKNNKKVKVIIDMMPDLSGKELKQVFNEQIKKFKDMSIYDVMCGIFNNKLTEYILLNAGIEGKLLSKELKDIDGLLSAIKGLSLDVIGTRGFEYAQVCAGGIDTRDVLLTMESKMVEGLYFVGEALDVDGMCGGYNLHFAFATGIIAGEDVAKG